MMATPSRGATQLKLSWRPSANTSRSPDTSNSASASNANCATNSSLRSRSRNDEATGSGNHRAPTVRAERSASLARCDTQARIFLRRRTVSSSRINRGQVTTSKHGFCIQRSTIRRQSPGVRSAETSTFVSRTLRGRATARKRVDYARRLPRRTDFVSRRASFIASDSDRLGRADR